MHTGKFSRMVIAGVVLSLLAVAACAKDYGRFALDAKVSAAFQGGVIQPDLQYFYSGRDTMPYAIIAIDRTYSVPSRYWIPFAPTPEQLKNMSQNIYREIQDYSYGARIVAPDGKEIGLWYSNVDARSVRVNQQERTVQILFVNPENHDHPG